jgi:hypothetical protein
MDPFWGRHCASCLEEPFEAVSDAILADAVPDVGKEQSEASEVPVELPALRNVYWFRVVQVGAGDNKPRGPCWGQEQEVSLPSHECAELVATYYEKDRPE